MSSSKHLSTEMMIKGRLTKNTFLYISYGEYKYIFSHHLFWWLRISLQQILGQFFPLEDENEKNPFMFGDYIIKGTYTQHFIFFASAATAVR